MHSFTDTLMFKDTNTTLCSFLFNGATFPRPFFSNTSQDRFYIVRSIRSAHGDHLLAVQTERVAQH